MAVARPQPGTTQDSEHTPEALLPYLAGLVASDGNMQSREVRIATSVMPFLHVVHNLVEALGYNPRISKVEGASIIRIYSTSLRKTLTNKYKIPVGKKAGKIIFPSWLDNAAKNHYISGYFDGDGSVSVIRSGKKGQWGPYQTIRTTFTSKSAAFLQGLREYLVSLGFTPTSLKAEVEVYRLKMYSRKNLELFARSFRIRHPVKIAKIGSVLGGEFVP